MQFKHYSSKVKSTKFLKTIFIYTSSCYSTNPHTTAVSHKKIQSRPSLTKAIGKLLLFLLFIFRFFSSCRSKCSSFSLSSSSTALRCAVVCSHQHNNSSLHNRQELEAASSSSKSTHLAEDGGGRSAQIQSWTRVRASESTKQNNLQTLTETATSPTSCD